MAELTQQVGYSPSAQTPKPGVSPSRSRVAGAGRPPSQSLP